MSPECDIGSITFPKWEQTEKITLRLAYTLNKNHIGYCWLLLYFLYCIMDRWHLRNFTCKIRPVLFWCAVTPIETKPNYLYNTLLQSMLRVLELPMNKNSKRQCYGRNGLFFAKQIELVSGIPTEVNITDKPWRFKVRGKGSQPCEWVTATCKELI